MPSDIGFKPLPPKPDRQPFLPLPAACAAGFAALVYLNALDNPFVYDDFHLIVENRSILASADFETIIVRDITRPLVTIMYALEARAWGLSAVGFHVTNLLLHVLNVVLVYWLARAVCDDRQRQTGQRTWREGSSDVVAFATAAIFAVHPMMTQAVGYISSRSEVLYSAFFLSAFLSARRWMLGGGTSWWAATVALWACALLSKESAAMLPVVLLAYDWLVFDAAWPERRVWLTRLVFPLLGLMVAAGIVRVAVLLAVEYRGLPGPDWRNSLVALDAVWRYLSLLFFPRDQSIFHLVPAIRSIFAPAALVAFGWLIAFALAAWRLHRVHSVITLGLLWFLLLLVPSSALLVLGRGEPLAEHRVYLSAVGIFLVWGCVFGEVWGRAASQRLLIGAGFAIFLAAFAFQTLVRNAIWHDPVRLAQEAVALAPTHWAPRMLVAEAFRQEERCDEAIPEYRLAIDYRPVEILPYTMLARCLIRERRLDEAEDTLRRLKTAHPSSQDAAMGLATFALLGGRLDESRAYFREVLTRDPRRGQAALMLSFLDGTLPDGDRRQVCDSLKAVTGTTPTLAGCDAAGPP